MIVGLRFLVVPLAGGVIAALARPAPGRQEEPVRI